jgi:hypothetical protein
MMSLQEIKDLIPTLSHRERKELLELLVDSFVESGSQSPAQRKRSLHELRGLGKEIWQGVDAQEYIDQQRDEWDRRP